MNFSRYLASEKNSSDFGLMLHLIFKANLPSIVAFKTGVSLTGNALIYLRSRSNGLVHSNIEQVGRIELKKSNIKSLRYQYDK